MNRPVKPLLSLLLVAAVVGTGAYWLTRIVEQPALVIMAATDVPENGLPVYAQFVVTQTLTLADPIRVSALQIPIYFPLPLC